MSSPSQADCTKLETSRLHVQNVCPSAAGPLLHQQGFAHGASLISPGERSDTDRCNHRAHWDNSIPHCRQYCLLLKRDCLFVLFLIAGVYFPPSRRLFNALSQPVAAVHSQDGVIWCARPRIESVPSYYLGRRLLDPYQKTDVEPHLRD